MAEDFVVCSTCLHQQSACICETAAAQTVEYLTPVETTECLRCVTCIRVMKESRRDFHDQCWWCKSHPEENEFDIWVQDRGTPHPLDPYRQDQVVTLFCPNCGHDGFSVYEDMNGWLEYGWNSQSRMKERTETEVNESSVASFNCNDCAYEIDPSHELFADLCTAYWDSDYY